MKDFTTANPKGKKSPRISMTPQKKGDPTIKVGKQLSDEAKKGIKEAPGRLDNPCPTLE